MAEHRNADRARNAGPDTRLPADVRVELSLDDRATPAFVRAARRTAEAARRRPSMADRPKRG